jgi:ribosomal protein S18 acetylase RimI-like enzyme
MSHPLDNPVWSSLASQHAALARSTANAARYPSDTAPFVAVDAADARVAAQLDELVDVGESVLFVGLAPPLPKTWIAEQPVPIAQMLCSSRLPMTDGPPIAKLSPSQVGDMLALTALVYPHYFRPRTIEMGRYFGIYDGEVLAAMAGERMGFEGYREISAVCTHPDHTGRGHARRLMALLNNDILDSGRVPFLHVSHRNARAKALYERLGYRFRTDIPLVAAQRIA